MYNNITLEEKIILFELFNKKKLNIIKRINSLSSLVLKLDEYAIQENIKITEIIYKILNQNLANIGICQMLECGKKTKFISCVEGYQKFCSCKCAQLSPQTKEKFKKTSLKKYGTEHPFQNKEIQKKHQKTCIEHFGYKDALSCPAIHELQRKNKFEKYGNEYYSNREKNIQTLYIKYGVKSSFNIPYVKEKIKNIKFEKYGDKYYNNYDKHKLTCLLRYGYDSYSKTATHKAIATKIFNDPINQLNAMKSQIGCYKLREYKLKDSRIILYQSLMELAYIKYCENNNIWIDNGDKIPYLGSNGKKHTYFVDFKIRENGKYRLIEIKGTTKWYYKSLENGTLLNKIKAAQQYSKENDYLPYKMKINFKNI
jgi:hypothetical protein